MGKALGGVSGPGGETADGTAPVEDTGQEVDIHLGGDVTWGGGVLDDGGIHQEEPEHGSTVHLYTITDRPVWGVGKGTRGASRDAVVGTSGLDMEGVWEAAVAAAEGDGGRRGKEEK